MRPATDRRQIDSGVVSRFPDGELVYIIYIIRPWIRPNPGRPPAKLRLRCFARGASPLRPLPSSDLATFVGITVWTAILMMNNFFFIAPSGDPEGFEPGDHAPARLPQHSEPPRPGGSSIGTLLGSLIAIGRLSADGEIVALQASGLGPMQQLRPMAIHGVVAMGLSLTDLSAASAVGQLRVARRPGAHPDGPKRNVGDSATGLLRRAPGYVLFVDEMPAGTQGIARSERSSTRLPRVAATVPSS